MGDGAFVKYRDDKPIGGLAPAYFEAVAVGTWRALSEIDKTVAPTEIKEAIVKAVQTDEFRSQVGPGANSTPKLRRRVEIIKDALLELAR